MCSSRTIPFSPTCARGRRRPERAPRAFTLIEVVAATLVMAVLAGSVMVIVDRCIAATANMELRARAFIVARENMERLLGETGVTEKTEIGQDERNPAIVWQTVVEPFHEPATGRMWIRAVCSASYVDSRDETQTVTLTHWLTSLTDKQIAQIQKQRDIEQQYMDMLSENDEHLQWQQVVRHYLTDRGMDVAGYDQVLLQQKAEKERWIQEYEYDPDLFDELLREMYQREQDWLADQGFDAADFDQWKGDNADAVAEIYSRPPIFYGGTGATASTGGATPGSGTGSSGQTPGSGSDGTSSGAQDSSRVSPELRKVLREALGWSDEFIDQVFGGGG